jgi:hypothetical protein
MGGACPRPGQWIQVVLQVPVVRVTGDIAKTLGYPVGVWWRWRRGRGG